MILSLLTVARFSFSAPSYTVLEGAGQVLVMVDLLSPNQLARDVQLQISSLDESASSGMDYTTLSQTLTFTPGNQSLSVSVTIIDDDTLEHSERFFLMLSTTDDDVEFENDTSSVYIIDNDCE